MNLIEFNKILSNPDQIKKGQIQGLFELIQEYPYFQVGHFLHLKGLKKRHSFKYNDYLKKTAAYTTDRALLFDHITSNDQDIHAAPANLLEQEEAAEDSKEPEVIEEVKTEQVEDLAPEEILGVGQPLDFKKDETYSFREWLQLTDFKPIEREKNTIFEEHQAENTTEKLTVKKKPEVDLIDKFIAASPRINPSLYDDYSDISSDSIQENESLMTETLAHVYVEQKSIKKRLQLLRF